MVVQRVRLAAHPRNIGLDLDVGMGDFVVDILDHLVVLHRELVELRRNCRVDDRKLVEVAVTLMLPGGIHSLDEP